MTEPPPLPLRPARLGALLLAALLLLQGPPVQASGEPDHQRAARLVEQGAILPLAEVLEEARSLTDGRLIGTELEFEHGRWVYEFEFLEQGEVWEYVFDASSGALVEREHD